MEQLRQLLPYRRLSAHQLRRLVERAISDPRSETLLQVDITPPRDDPLGEAVRATLPSLQEVIIIPSLEHLDAQEVPTYLGIAAARAFEGRFVGGQGIGLGDGRAIHAFVTALRLPPLLLAHLQFFALTHCPTATISGWGAENVLQLIADHWASRSGRQLQGYIAPTQLRAERLHWAFVEIDAVGGDDKGQRRRDFGISLTSIPKGTVAEVAGHFLRADGQWLGRLAPIESIPLAVLRRMVETGRNVVGLAGGAEKAPAVLAALRAGILNRLVTDDRCAATLLELVVPRWRMADVPSRPQWWEASQRFFAAHLRYRHQPRLSVSAIANRLRLSPKTVRRLLEEARQGKGEQPPMVRLTVQAPSEAMKVELALLRTFQLQEARVVTVAAGEEGLQRVGEEAAQLFFDLARDQTALTVGFGGGRTVGAMLRSLGLPASLSRLPKLATLHLWALDSNPLPKAIGLAAHTLIAALAMRCLSVTDRIVRCFAYQEGQEAMALDAVFIGIGVFAPSETLYLYAQEVGLPVKELAGKVAGSTLFQGISADGQIMPLGFEGRVKALPLERLQRLVQEGKPVIVLASGAHKAPAILAAHRAQLFNGLVVDCDLAVALLRGAAAPTFNAPSSV
jgi:DNA-binding transcriptional regulator LsrR (DeoR family)